MSYLFAVIILGVLIFVHELGHFLLAKFCGVGVIEFAIGFGPKLFSKKFGETTYSLRAIPLGGYVRMVGDDPRLAHSDSPEGSAVEALLTGEEPEVVDPETQRLLADKSRWFVTQGLAGRSAIVLAGPLFNLGFALILALVTVVVYGAGVPVEESIIGGIMRDHPADRANLKPEDHVIAIDGVAVTSWEQLAKTVASSQGRKMIFEIERPSETATPEKLTLEIQGEPESAELALLTNEEPGKNFKIGISPKFERKPVALSEAPRIAVEHIWNLSSTTIKGLWYMLRGSISSKNIAGPIYIFGEAASSTRKGLAYSFDFMILLSVSLAILNLLPIPVLDGGHLLFFLLEALRGGRPLSLRALQIANNVGLAMLLGLMAFALGNDLLRQFTH